MTKRCGPGMFSDVGRLEGRDASLAVESEVSALLAAGYSRTDATRLIERTLTEARHATTVVLVEGLSDQIALEVLAERQGRALRADGTFVVPTGGVTNFARFLAIFGPGGRDVRLAGLYDSPSEDEIRRSLETAGVSQGDGTARLESFRFYGCVTDLEDEMIRALGSRQVEHVVAAESDLGSFRRLQRMPFHRQRSLDEQLHRFIGTHSGRKYRYARSLALSLDLSNLPKPLAGLLEHLDRRRQARFRQPARAGWNTSVECGRARLGPGSPRSFHLSKTTRSRACDCDRMTNTTLHTAVRPTSGTYDGE
jgi:hypothetical protein